jgi:hypothetical protein
VFIILGEDGQHALAASPEERDTHARRIEIRFTQLQK